MNAKRFALFSGIVLLIMGVTSFLIPGFTESADLIPLRLNLSYGMYLGLFPLNILNKTIFCLLGMLGFQSFFSTSSSRSFNESVIYRSQRYARWVSSVMIPLAILGLIPQTQTLFGYLPLLGNSVFAHALFGLLGLYFGYMHSERPLSYTERDPSCA